MSTFKLQASLRHFIIYEVQVNQELPDFAMYGTEPKTGHLALLLPTPSF